MDLTSALHILSRNKKKEPVAPQIKQYVNTPKVICPYCDFEHDDSCQQSVVTMCSNCGKQFHITVTRTSTGKRSIILGQSLDHEYFAKTYTTHQIRVIEKKTFDQIATVEEAVEQLNAEMLSVEDLRDMIIKKGWDVTAWNIDNEANPFAKEGIGFKWNCNHNERGKFFQWVVKPIILRAIDFYYGTARALYGKDRVNFIKRWFLRKVITIVPGMLEYANKTMLTHYDKDAFVLEDAQDIRLRSLVRQHIGKYFIHDYPRKALFMLKCTDMVFALKREDVFYSARSKVLLNTIIHAFPNGFALTSVEQANLIAADVEAKRLISEKKQTVDMELFK